MKNCVELIKNLPLLQFDAKNVNDVSTVPHDITHNTDALRYFCISHFSSAKEQKPEESDFDKYKKKLLSGRKNRRRW